MMALDSNIVSLLILSLFYCPNMFCVNATSLNATSYREFLVMGQSVRISDTLVSKGGKYELGFFNTKMENSTKYYVGIRSKKVPNDKIVWVEIYYDPFVTSSALLTIHNGNIRLIDGDNTHDVTSNQNSNSISIYATLLDTGNLVLKNNSNQAILWQSFDNPSDTLLPGMKIGNTSSMRSWGSEDDPTEGRYTLEGGYTLSLVDSGSLTLSSMSYVLLDFKQFGLKQNDNEYYTLPTDSNSRLILEAYGDLKYQNWSEESKSWVVLLSSKCVTDNSCGRFSICNPHALVEPCQCLDGFKPSDADSWRQGDMSDGCVRKKELSCSKDRFLNMSVESPPPHEYEQVDTAAHCNYTCFTDCSCVAYAYDGDNCMLWKYDVPTLKNTSIDINGNKEKTNFYLKLAGSDRLITNSNAIGRHGNRKRNLLVIVILNSFLLFLLLLGLFVYRTRKQWRNGDDLLNFEVGMSMKVNKDSDIADKSTKVKKKEVKLPLFSFVSVSAATNNFSDTNKLGEGGFGPVYKGILLNGDEVAVKRLSRRSGQGWEELQNEALLIAKLQHNNLVRLLGCCIDRDEKLLIYEFMPNKSLDCFLFDAVKRRILDWETRVRIIQGIAQGLLYLHHYSRFRIIHRDLKASNILLDSNMNPKISDFGMARIFGENELRANTNRIVGTYGYMSPEYAMEGLFSVKSDVFSFGVLLLEIISGKKNTGFYQTSSFNLLGYAWDLWTNDSGMELIDSELDDISNKHLVPRYVNIGLLCVQQSPEDRPTMSDVVSMFGNDTASLPGPKPPAFQNIRGIEYSRLPKSIEENFSVYGITDSVIEAR